MNQHRCNKPATLCLVDGDPWYDHYTLTCAEHEEEMKSDTHTGTFPHYDADYPHAPPATCCYVKTVMRPEGRE